ncbi:MAG: Gfo/Idh/MocA family oxidoreductase [Comamonadaceae bacterium]|nr:MAG: Gfo/Idh/MocA family oxidoreductase [Comamonadaceae bacterium]
MTAPSQTTYTPPEPIDTGSVKKGAVKFGPWRGDADKPAGQPPAPLPPEKRVGFAVVGLGRLTLEELLPAFADCKKARVTALVSGTPAKLKAVATQYGIDPGACYSYEQFEQLGDNQNVQAVFIVLPNAMHREFTERAAAIGKHVLCEKPLATSSADARAMVSACERADVRLMTAYRIHYQPHNLRARALVQGGTYGRAISISATNVQTSSPDAAHQWRHKLDMAGGGALPDIGLYCLNTVRFISGEEPVEVMAWQHSPTGDPRFAEVEATVSFMLRFPSGLVANCHTSYDAREDKHQRIQLNRATIDMPNAYAYEGQRLFIGERHGDDSGNTELTLAPVNQFAAEIDHMAECVIEGKTPDTPGEEGVRDHVLMEAIYESARSGRPVKV